MSTQLRLALFSLIIAVTIQFGGCQEGLNRPANPEQQLIRSLRGEDLFMAYCASCHGLDAQGKGPVAAELRSKIPDLTAIAAKNKGAFPRERVRSTIVGDQRPIAHGTRQMPVWGPFFSRVEEDVDYGNVRVENLVRYLESIQLTPSSANK